jgi:hypothetical protein
VSTPATPQLTPSPPGTLISTAVFLLLLVAIAVNVVITFRNAYVQELLTIGWGPLFLAMAISRFVAPPSLHKDPRDAFFT